MIPESGTYWTWFDGSLVTCWKDGTVTINSLVIMRCQNYLDRPNDKNARLIASAPLLLEACIKANDVFHAKTSKEEEKLRFEIIGLLENAIYKAQGK
jgi:hypothetical protein